MKKLIALIVAFILCGIFLAVEKPWEPSIPAAGTTYYVSTGGNDSTGDGSIGSPWLTFTKAATEVVAGDTVYGRGGTYTFAAQVDLAVDGSSGNYITFASYPGETARVDGQNLSFGVYNGAFQIEASYIIVEGFTISNVHKNVSGAGGGICAYDPARRINNIIIRNNYIYDCGGAGIQTLNVDTVTINGNELNDVCDQGSQEGISLIRSTDFDIYNNYIYNFAESYQYYCTDYGPKEGIDVKVGCHTGKIHHNHIKGGRHGIYVDGFGSDSYGIDIYNNHLENFYDYGIILGAESGGNVEDLYNIKIYNNVIHDSIVTSPNNCYARAGICLVGNVGTFDNIDIHSNLVYNVQRSSMLIDGNANPDYTGLYIRNNIFWSQVNTIDGSATYDEGAAEYYTGEHIWSQNVYGLEGSFAGSQYWGANYLTGTPTWTAAASGCAATAFTQDSASITVNAGTPAGAPDTDYNDESRPQQINYDIGPFEYDPTGAVVSATLSFVASEVPWDDVGKITLVDKDDIKVIQGVEIQ